MKIPVLELVEMKFPLRNLFLIMAVISGMSVPAGIRKYIEEGNDPSTLPAYSVGAMLPSLLFLILAIHFYNKEKQKLSEIDVFLDADDFNEEVDDVEVIP
ncbi:hypothetical protein OAF74_00825 [bacterium]|nr:hypothetical protein [bacterium]